MGQEVARLQAEHVRLVNANTLERERIHASESRAQFSTWSELAIERQQQERLREHLREERDKIAYLEKMHCDLSAESFKLGGQRTELGAVRQQVEKLTQDRRRYLESMAPGPQSSVSASVQVGPPSTASSLATPPVVGPIRGFHEYMTLCAAQAFKR